MVRYAPAWFGRVSWGVARMIITMLQIVTICNIWGGMEMDEEMEQIDWWGEPTDYWDNDEEE